MLTTHVCMRLFAKLPSSLCHLRFHHPPIPPPYRAPPHSRSTCPTAHCPLPTTNTNARPAGSAAATAAQRLSVDNDRSHGSNYVLPLLLLLCSVVPGDERWWVLRVVIPGRNNTGIDTTPPSTHSTGTPRAGLNGPIITCMLPSTSTSTPWRCAHLWRTHPSSPGSTCSRLN